MIFTVDFAIKNHDVLFGTVLGIVDDPVTKVEIIELTSTDSRKYMEYVRIEAKMDGCLCYFTMLKSRDQIYPRGTDQRTRAIGVGVKSRITQDLPVYDGDLLIIGANQQAIELHMNEHQAVLALNIERTTNYLNSLKEFQARLEGMLIKDQVV
jgi:hypothetical protein